MTDGFSRQVLHHHIPRLEVFLDIGLVENVDVFIIFVDSFVVVTDHVVVVVVILVASP
ncbi:MAG: hypothetical protein ACYC1I_10220 [Acidimicrobiales bacterium]